MSDKHYLDQTVSWLKMFDDEGNVLSEAGDYYCPKCEKKVDKEICPECESKTEKEEMSEEQYTRYKDMSKKGKEKKGAIDNVESDPESGGGYKEDIQSEMCGKKHAGEGDYNFKDMEKKKKEKMSDAEDEDEDEKEEGMKYAGDGDYDMKKKGKYHLQKQVKGEAKQPGDMDHDDKKMQGRNVDFGHTFREYLEGSKKRLSKKN